MGNNTYHYSSNTVGDHFRMGVYLPMYLTPYLFCYLYNNPP